MIIAWVIFASFGMIIARYFKFIFPDRRIFELKVWFVIHRPLMLSAFLLSFIALMVILADKNWTWIDKYNLTSFVHSIFGMITIGLAFIQVNISQQKSVTKSEIKIFINKKQSFL